MFKSPLALVARNRGGSSGRACELPRRTCVRTGARGAVVLSTSLFIASSPLYLSIRWYCPRAALVHRAKSSASRAWRWAVLTFCFAISCSAVSAATRFDSSASPRHAWRPAQPPGCTTAHPSQRRPRGKPYEQALRRFLVVRAQVASTLGLLGCCNEGQRKGHRRVTDDVLSQLWCSGTEEATRARQEDSPRP